MIKINFSKLVAIQIIFVLIYISLYSTWIQTITIDYFAFKYKTSITWPELDDENGREVLILFWTKMFHLGHLVHDGTETFDFVDGYLDGMFEKCPSPANRCRVTNNQSLIEQSEAVIFHAQDLQEGIKWPEFRSPEQRWIFFNFEAPIHTNKEKLPSNLHFNWTFTYRRDSDVILPYGPSTAGEYRQRLALEREKPFLSLPTAVNNKTKLVAWMVSHCDAKSGRGLYVEELKKHIQVDVYGKCGSLKCDNKTGNIENLNPPTGCYEMLERDYKFYLSFENSICPDYVTEKFYNVLLFTTVPIVYGGADYEAIGAPPNSYIDVRNFTSARHLANFLQYLDKNETAYRSYFDWRLKPPGLASLRRVKPWCNLCQKLQTENKVNKQQHGLALNNTNVNNQHMFSISALTRRSYDDIYSWWFVKDSCQSLPINPL